MKSLPLIADKLKAVMGLDMATVGSSLIERVVRERMAALGIADDGHYLARLQGSAAELQALIELAVVPETWFFRDREAIFAVARLARERLLSQPDVPVRILSLPCSTGEEPYSVAMALLEAGVMPSQFVIDAYDIRTRSLEIAAAGVYGRNSFRGQALGFRDRHFMTVEQGWQLEEAIRRQVRFAPGNLLAPDLLRQAAPYDFIFCRNVLIYFEREVQRQVVSLLESLMKPDAVIFVGPAEGGLMLSPRLESAGIALAFGFRKRVAVEKPAWRETVLAAAQPLLAAPVPARRARPAASALVADSGINAFAAPVPAPLSASSQPLLQRARSLADAGQFTQAAVLCEQAIEEQGPSADAFYLQGLIHDAGGDAGQAQRCYRKVLYLAPQHQAALLQLAALLQAQGDTAGAERLRQRASRVTTTEEPHHG